MGSRVQGSPFRETEWDQRLDKMLDDLKTTVSPGDSRPSSRLRDNARDNALVSSFRSSSRSGSQTRGGIEDGGQMKHKHSEYTSPDKSTKVVSDQYEYGSGDTRNNAFQKKVLQSTYSSYKVKGDLTSQLDELTKGPTQYEMDSAAKDTKVVSASQKVANKLVDALASIGPDDTDKSLELYGNTSNSSTLETKGTSDYSTLSKLHKNINELDDLLEHMNQDEKQSVEFHKESVRSEYVWKNNNTVQSLEEVVSKRNSDIPEILQPSREINVFQINEAVDKIRENKDSTQIMEFTEGITSRERTNKENRSYSLQETATKQSANENKTLYDLTEPNQTDSEMVPKPNKDKTGEEIVQISEETVSQRCVDNSNTVQTFKIVEETKKIVEQNEAKDLTEIKRNVNQESNESVKGEKNVSEECCLLKLVDIEDGATGSSKPATGPEDGQSPYSNEYFSSKYSKGSSSLVTPVVRDEDADNQGSEVRRIVWRNRFEKTCEAQDSRSPPEISIEEAAKAAQRARNQPDFSFNKTTNGPILVHNNNVSSPGGWVDPIPIPTPPQQMSPTEPGVAYVYTYPSQGSATRVQHLPPLNYVSHNPNHSLHAGASDGAPSPTPSSASQQPIIYHYSYHYNILPGQSLPDGVHKPPGGGHQPPPPALQMAPSSTSYPPSSHHIDSSSRTNIISSNYPSDTSRTTNANVLNSNNSNAIHNSSTSTHHQNYSTSTTTKNIKTSNLTNQNDNIYKRLDINDSTRGKSPPRNDGPKPRDDIIPSSSSPLHYPSSQPQSQHPSSNISVNINKTTTHTTHTRDFPHGGGPISGSGPTTSTPFTTPGRGRSRSVSPEKGDHYPRGRPTYPVGHPLYNTTHNHYYSSSTSRSDRMSDSLERLKRPTSEGMPFPDTSPIKGPGQNNIPRRVDDLMHSFTDSEHDGLGGPHGPMLNGQARNYEREPLVDHKNARETEITATTELNNRDDRRELTKNVAGGAVYYPPGHQPHFNDAMHTMTLKENKRRGMAKWRMEKASGMKESSSASESKGGMAMVPVCLPLCCGAACTIM